LFHDYVSKIHINDLSRPIFAFWHSVLNETDRLCALVCDTPLRIDSWDEQKKIFACASEHDDLAVGFAAFFLNRTNRSGILNGGIIGGRDQTGPWKIDARFNRRELIFRIQEIAKLGKRICLSRVDAIDFLKAGVLKWPEKTLIYLDPPYYVKGRDLYYDFYKPEDHAEVADFVTTTMFQHRWIVSYDNAPEIRALYRGFQRIVYDIGYSAGPTSPEGREVMFFSDGMRVCPMVGPVKIVKGAGMTRNAHKPPRKLGLASKLAS
jgi:DNA adenine methylase